MKVVWIKNVKSRLGREVGYYDTAIDGFSRFSRGPLRAYFTDHELISAVRRAKRNARHLPDPPKIGRLRLWAIRKLGGCP